MKSWKPVITLQLTSYHCTHNQRLLWWTYGKPHPTRDWTGHNQPPREIN